VDRVADGVIDCPAVTDDYRQHDKRNYGPADSGPFTATFAM